MRVQVYARELRKKIIGCYIRVLVYFLTHAFTPISDRMAMTKCIEEAKIDSRGAK